MQYEHRCYGQHPPMSCTSDGYLNLRNHMLLAQILEVPVFSLSRLTEVELLQWNLVLCVLIITTSEAVVR